MQRPATRTARLRLLATSDVHMHLLPHDYFRNRPSAGTGLEALAATMARLRAQAAAEDPPRHTLLVDNGDTLQGTVLADHLARDAARGETRESAHPLARVMNDLGYDAMGLGNHDLDYGLDYLGWFARSLRAPLISSNLALAPAPDWLRPWALLEAGPVTVGILSVLPPNTVTALRAQLGASARADAMVETARRTARHLTEAGADIVLGLAHTGLRGRATEDALAEIARTGAVDALVGGHTHGVFPGDDASGQTGAIACDCEADHAAGTLHGVPTVMPGWAGALLGCIDLDLDLESRPGSCWTVTAGRGRVIAPDSRAPHVTRDDPAFDPIRPAHAAVCAALDRVIAQTPVPLTSYFAQVRPTAIHALTAAAQMRAIDARRQGTPQADLPLLSAVSLPRAGGSGGTCNYTDIPAGPIRARHLAELCVYANFVWAVQVSGAELVEWLEKSASAFACVGADSGGGLFDADFPAFDFDVMHGLNYMIDPTLPARYDRAGRLRDPATRRIGALRHAGAPVEPEAQFLVAVNSFRACGGGNFPGLHPDRPVLTPELLAADAIRDYLAGGADPPEAACWRFAARCAGTATWFETGPGALAHLDDIAHLRPGRPERQSSGFVRIPITL